jgi:hypothetical protein
MAVSLKDKMMEQGLKLMADPRVAKLMTDPKVMKALMAAMSVPGKVSTFTTEQAEKVAKAMALASEQEVNDLKRTVRRLEEEIAELRRDREADKKR